MALIWDDRSRKDPPNETVSVNYSAQIPHWGEASIQSHIHHPGELFLNCPALGIDMHPLGQVILIDALTPAEMVLLRTLKEHAVWCLEAMVAIGNMEG